MDITSDLAAVAARIAEITGSASGAVPLATGQTGPDGLPVLNPSAMGNSPFAALVQAALAADRAQPTTDGDGIPFAPAANAPDPVPPEEIDRLVSASESGFDASATSSAGAQGLMQLMPATAQGLGVSDPYDPAQNVWGGTRYIRRLLDRFDGNLELAVAAYNAGPNAVSKYGGIPPYAETQNYVQNVLSSYEKYKSQMLERAASYDGGRFRYGTEPPDTIP
jgi:hypothetical protein